MKRTVIHQIGDSVIVSCELFKTTETGELDGYFTCRIVSHVEGNVYEVRHGKKQIQCSSEFFVNTKEL